MKNFPKETRTCIACKSKKDKNDCIRIAKLNNGEIYVDEESKLGGRGVYICQENTCIKKVISKNLLNKSFKINVKKDIYDHISERIQ
ncbi:MAG: hypothetical protein BWX72_00612 [Firmicutes bacterium ADurb.Bin080]|nr:MAG: hypothetical protein BWX72_00612 [Firmicutes bacterium ADurb.Bin080]